MGGQIHLEVSGWHAECGGMGNAACGMRHTSASMKLQTDVKSTLCVIIIYVLYSVPIRSRTRTSTSTSTQPSPVQTAALPSTAQPQSI